ncbi:MAG: coproporphyrinogen III oxidase family protein [Coriobacteriales bacterium]|jgi:coproporphyrinogen III oxidase-like Fe-S oxidoreductase|nr:coproporphyrinogen III oxidase family protein [Coriobacteriales bacterium]
MFLERIQSTVVRRLNRRYLRLRPTDVGVLPVPRIADAGEPAGSAGVAAAPASGPAPGPGAAAPAAAGPAPASAHPSPSAAPAPKLAQDYLLYMHVPFCERLCPYCSFNRYPFSEERARPYFENLRREMLMLKERGYDCSALYVGGGTPTIMIDELCKTIDLARETFSIREVSSETNPNHLTPEIVDRLAGRVQRLSVGVQSFNDDLLRQMERYEAYGSGLEALGCLMAARGRFDSLNVDMIFNFPSQTEDMLVGDLAAVLESGANQVTFYPLMASPVVARSLARSVGQVDYRREERYYRLICEALTGGRGAPYDFGSAWTFNAQAGERDKSAMIDEYIVDFEEYPALGSGGMSFLDGGLYVNTFSVKNYNKAIESGRMSVMGYTPFTKVDRMRYRLMMQLFGLRLDKRRFKQDFGCDPAYGLPIEYAFFKAAGAFAHEDEDEIVLSAKGRYLMVALMREFFVGVNTIRDQARAALDGEERILLFGA